MPRRLVAPSVLVLSLLAITACSRPTSSYGQQCRAGFCIAKVDLIPSEFGDAGSGRPTDEPIWVATTTVLDPLPDGVTLATRYASPRRIRWEVTEQFLIARDVTDPIAPFDDPPIYSAYRIESHFDPNEPPHYAACDLCAPEPASTPWTLRPLMRVDWSMDLVDTQFANTNASDTVVTSPIPVYVNRPDDPNAPLFECGGSTCGPYLDAGGPLSRIALTHRAAISARRDADAGSASDAAVGDAGTFAAEVRFRVEYARAQ